jgi:hypothetical protein
MITAAAETSQNVLDSTTCAENARNESVQNVFANDNVVFVENVDNAQCTNTNLELDEIMSDVENDCVYIPEILKNVFEQESNVPLYPECIEFSKISAVFALYNLKAKNGWSDKSFTSLLKLLGQMLPKDTVLSDSNYGAKKLLCPLTLEVERIHACPNDYILYRGEEYSKLNKCPICNASRYKLRDDDAEDDKKKSPAKVL